MGQIYRACCERSRVTLARLAIRKSEVLQPVSPPVFQFLKVIAPAGDPVGAGKLEI